MAIGLAFVRQLKLWVHLSVGKPELLVPIILIHIVFLSFGQ